MKTCPWEFNPNKMRVSKIKSCLTMSLKSQITKHMSWAAIFRKMKHNKMPVHFEFQENNNF
jgi:hypothetical protein